MYIGVCAGLCYPQWAGASGLAFASPHTRLAFLNVCGQVEGYTVPSAEAKSVAFVNADICGVCVNLCGMIHCS